MAAEGEAPGPSSVGLRAVPRDIDGPALEAELYLGVDAGGDADVGVAEEFLDYDEVDLLEEQSGGRVPEVVEAGVAKSRPTEESAEASSQVGGVEGAAGRGGEDESVVRPARSCGLTFFLLVFPVALERVNALGGEGGAAFGSAGLGVQGEFVQCVQPVTAGGLEELPGLGRSEGPEASRPGRGVDGDVSGRWLRTAAGRPGSTPTWPTDRRKRRH
jgi:hypothetical protein